MRSDFTPKLILQRAIRVFVLLKLITSFMSSEGENNRHLHDGIILLTRPECNFADCLFILNREDKFE